MFFEATVAQIQKSETPKLEVGVRFLYEMKVQFFLFCLFFSPDFTFLRFNERSEDF